MEERIFQNTPIMVTGLGPVTNIGVGRESLWTSVANGRHHVEQRDLPVDLGQKQTFALAAMPETDRVPGLAPVVDTLAQQDAANHRALAYTLLACELALADAGMEVDTQHNNIGLIQVFEAPGVEQTVDDLFTKLVQVPRIRSMLKGPPPVYEMLAPHFYNMQPFLYVHLAAKALGLHGFSNSIHNACSSGPYAVEVAANVIRSGQADAMLVAGGEAFDTGVRMEWFRRLDLHCVDGRMAPFDARQTGFYCGEGAGAMLLESADHAEKRGAKPHAIYRGASFAQQGWKQVIPDLANNRLAGVITTAMQRADVAPEQIDLIVPHGAATSLSDKYEGTCLAQALQDKAGNASCTALKPYVGHMLAASGLIETIIAICAMNKGTVPATLHTKQSMRELPVTLAGEPVTRELKTLLKLSTGFTGHDAAAIYQRS